MGEYYVISLIEDFMALLKKHTKEHVPGTGSSGFFFFILHLDEKCSCHAKCIASKDNSVLPYLLFYFNCSFHIWKDDGSALSS